MAKVCVRVRDSLFQQILETALPKSILESPRHITSELINGDEDHELWLIGANSGSRHGQQNKGGQKCA